MSMGMSVYVVDEADAKAIVGSNDKADLEWLFSGDAEEMLADLDEYLVDDPDDELEFTHADAVRDIITGNFTRPEAGLVYAGAYEYICGVMGEMVQDRFHRCHPQVLSELDRALAAHGVGLRFWDVLVGRVPVALPDCDELSLGHWTEAEVLAAAPAFRAMMAAGVEGEEYLTAYLNEVGEWINAVEAQPGSMIFASYS